MGYWTERTARSTIALCQTEVPTSLAIHVVDQVASEIRGESPSDQFNPYQSLIRCRSSLRRHRHCKEMVVAVPPTLTLVYLQPITSMTSASHPNAPRNATATTIWNKTGSMREDGHESTLRRIVVMTSKLPKSVVSLDKILLFQYYEELNCNDDGRNNWYIGRFSCPNTLNRSLFSFLPQSATGLEIFYQFKPRFVHRLIKS